MQKRIFTLALVVVIGVLAGVTIVKKQVKEPILREILQRQQALLEAQNRIERTVGSGGATEDGIPSVANLEKRIAGLEAQVKKLQDAVKSGGGVAAARPQEDLTTVHDIPVKHSAVRGDKNAPVTITEFVDFQCPFCARFHAPIIEALEAYPGKVNYVLKNFPLSFHNQARSAARAAFAAGEQGKYWEMADAMLKDGRALNDDKFVEIAKEIGLDVQRFKEDYVDVERWEKLIKDDVALGQKVGVRGTPTFYINGRKTRARDFNSLKKEIDAILSK